MSDFEEEIYSTMFTSLKHAIRRKILRMLSKKPRTFSEISKDVEISTSHLTYHLENLGGLVFKTDDGKYKLSKFGEAAVGTMGVVEEVRNTDRFSSLHIKWKSFFVVLTIGLVLLSGVSCIQYVSLNKLSAEFKQLSIENQQLSARVHSLDMQESTLCNVQLTGDITMRDETRIHDIERNWLDKVVVHSDDRPYGILTFVETTPGLWYVNETLDFAGDQESKFAFDIYKETGEAWSMHACPGFRFGRYTQEDVDKGIIIDRYVGWWKYRLVATYACGEWEGESMPYGTITVDDKPFKILQMFYTPVTEGDWKGGTHVRLEEVWRVRLSFTVTIAPIEEG